MRNRDDLGVIIALLVWTAVSLVGWSIAVVVLLQQWPVMFHTPAERSRVVEGPMASEPGLPAGAFIIDSIEPGWSLILICDDGRAPEMSTGWQHVSVRAHRGTGRTLSRVPTWREMCHVKALCWDAEDVVMQLHPAASAYVNTHPHVLHLWRPIDQPIPVPPKTLV